MKTKAILSFLTLLLATAIGTSGAFAARKNKKAPLVPLTEAGQKRSIPDLSELQADGSTTLLRDSLIEITSHLNQT